MVPAILLVTDRRAVRGGDLVGAVVAAVRGGVDAVQLREKDLDDCELLDLARRLRAVAPILLVNDRADVAFLAKADGVVLPADGLPAADARAILGPDATIGRSTHSGAEVEAARAEGADFAIFGPVFDTPSKRAFGPPQGLDRLTSAASAGIPIVAIGGITPENVAAVRHAGAHGVAVVRHVLEAADPERAARKLQGGDPT